MAAGHDHRRIGLEEGDLLRQLLGRPGIVGVEEGEVLALGGGDRTVACFRRAAILLADDDGEIVAGEAP